MRHPIGRHCRSIRRCTAPVGAVLIRLKAGRAGRESLSWASSQAFLAFDFSLDFPAIVSTRRTSETRSSLSEIFTNASAIRNACGSNANIDTDQGAGAVDGRRQGHDGARQNLVLPSIGAMLGNYPVLAKAAASRFPRACLIEFPIWATRPRSGHLRFFIGRCLTACAALLPSTRDPIEENSGKPNQYISWSIARRRRRYATTAEDWCAYVGHGPRTTKGRNERQER